MGHRQGESSKVKGIRSKGRNIVAQRSGARVKAINKPPTLDMPSYLCIILSYYDSF